MDRCLSEEGVCVGAKRGILWMKKVERSDLLSQLQDVVLDNAPSPPRPVLDRKVGSILWSRKEEQAVRVPSGHGLCTLASSPAGCVTLGCVTFPESSLSTVNLPSKY